MSCARSLRCSALPVCSCFADGCVVADNLDAVFNFTFTAGHLDGTVMATTTTATGAVHLTLVP